MKIGPQSVSLIGCPFSAQPNFAFCSVAIGGEKSVRVLFDARVQGIVVSERTRELNK